MTKFERLAPLIGIAAVGFYVLEALISGQTPTIDDRAADTVRYWTSHVGTQEIATGSMGLSAVAFGWFGGSVRSAIGRMGEGAARLGSIAQSGTVLIAVGLSIYAGVGLTAVHTAGKVPPETTRTLTILAGEDLFMTLAVGTALLVTATAIAIRRHKVLRPWFGWVSLVLAVVAVVVVFLGTMVPGLGFLAWLLLILWVPTLSVLLYRDQASATA